MTLFNIIVSGTFVLALVGAFYFWRQLSKTQDARFDALQNATLQALDEVRRMSGQSAGNVAMLGQMQSHMLILQQTVSDKMANIQIGMEGKHAESLKTLQGSMLSGIEFLQRQVGETLLNNSQELGKRLETLTVATDRKLQEISGQVERRLSEGFEKTTATFSDVVKRLALIDEAQKKITELSGNVVSLQEILSDKRSRGAFGEVQLEAIVRNMLPETCFKMQYRFPNSADLRIVDCMLFLPEPTGNVPVDSKFPLESFRKMLDSSLSEADKKLCERQFRTDVKKHIQDISSKYLVPGHTSDGAIMFLPAEAVFAEIHAHHPEIVEEAQRQRVWLASPTTFMAILTTARSVIKDAATRKQVHVIQEHLVKLSKDFERFQKRMDALAQHISKANDDVKDVATSAKKITSHFEKIERVDLGTDSEPETTPLLS